MNMKSSTKNMYCNPCGTASEQMHIVQTLTMWVFCFLVAIHCIENTSLIYENLQWIEIMYKIRNLMYVLLLAKAGFAAVYRPRELWCMLLVLAAAALSLIFSTDFTLMEFAIIAIALKDLPHRKLLYAFAVIKSAAIVLTLAGTCLHLIPNIIYENGNEGVYYTYGFCHRNVLGANMSVICLAWLYLRYNHLRVLDLLLWIVMTGLTYMLALSRTSLLIMVMSIFVMAFCYYLGSYIARNKFFRRFIMFCFVCMVVMCVVCTIFYDQDHFLLKIVDKIFTKRLLFAKQCLDEYGFSLFGQDIQFVSTLQAQTQSVDQPFYQQMATRLILDNSYMRVLVYNGIIPGALFILSYCLAILHTWKRKNMALVAGMMIMAFYGVSERFMLDVNYNFPLLLAFISMFRQPTMETIDTYRYPMEYVGEVLCMPFKLLRKLVTGAKETIE